MRANAAPCYTDGGILANSVYLVKFWHTLGMTANIAEGEGRYRDVSAIRAIQPVSNTFAKR